MRVQIKARHVEVTKEMRIYIERRLHFALSRFSTELRGVLVRLEDVNGPRGGVDKRCQITLRGPRFGNVTIDEMSGDVLGAVDTAADRAARTVARALERAREHVVRAGRTVWSAS